MTVRDDRDAQPAPDEEPDAALVPRRSDFARLLIAGAFVVGFLGLIVLVGYVSKDRWKSKPAAPPPGVAAIPGFPRAVDPIASLDVLHRAAGAKLAFAGFVADEVKPDGLVDVSSYGVAIVAVFVGDLESWDVRLDRDGVHPALRRPQAPSELAVPRPSCSLPAVWEHARSLDERARRPEADAARIGYPAHPVTGGFSFEIEDRGIRLQIPGCSGAGLDR